MEWLNGDSRYLLLKELCKSEGTNEVVILLVGKKDCVHKNLNELPLH